VDDPYQHSAEFIDLLIRDHWKLIGPTLTHALRLVDPAQGPLVDIGAGSGIGTRLAADTVADLEILAVEPSPALRAVLLSRVADSHDLQGRVTVLADQFQTAVLPDRLSGVIAMNVLGHFSPDERQQLWSLLANRLSPGGPALFNVLPPAEPVAVPDSLMAQVTVGRHRYEGWAMAEPGGDDLLLWHMTYRTLRDGQMLDERRATYRWWVASQQRLADELAVHGLSVEAAGPAEAGLFLVRGHSGRSSS
jgi:SAM-dependent methyltransferase